MSPFDFDKGTDEGYVPEHIRPCIESYVLNGWQPGGFVTAVLLNDLFRASARADHENYGSLALITRWVFNNLPEECYGTEQNMEDWMKDKNGRRTKYTKQLEKELTWRILKK